MAQKIVVALGGNALQSGNGPATAEAQLEVVKHTCERIAEIVDGTSVRIVDYAIIPSKRSGPSLLQNTALGILIGGILSAAVVVVKYLMNDISQVMIHSADDLRALYPDFMVLATIPDVRLSEKKNGYYSTYYASEESRKKGGKHNGR